MKIKAKLPCTSSLRSSLICKFIPEVRCAHFLNKMVRIASSKSEIIQFHKYSTSWCGFKNKKAEADR